MIEFFQNDHRDKDIMFFEAENGGRVMHQHVGIQDKQFFIR
jgi:hypothetical protein